MEVGNLTKIKLVTDSSVQLTPEEIAEYDITVVPLTITIDGKSYVDGEDITRSDFVTKMQAAKDLPTTSQPSIGTFVDIFKELAADGSEILAIFMTEGLSGTVNAARQAAEMMDGEKVTVLDSDFIDRGLAQQLIYAGKDIAAGKEMPEILAHVEQIKNDTFLRLAIVNLDNIIKGGRLGTLTGRIATLLNIKAILKMENGKLEIDQKGRGQKTVNKFKQEMLDKIKSDPEIVEVGLSHVEIDAEMQEFATEIKKINPAINVVVRETSPIAATHTGVGAFAVFLLKK